MKLFEHLTTWWTGTNSADPLDDWRNIDIGVDKQLLADAIQAGATFKDGEWWFAGYNAQRFAQSLDWLDGKTRAKMAFQRDVLRHMNTHGRDKRYEI